MCRRGSQWEPRHVQQTDMVWKFCKHCLFFADISIPLDLELMRKMFPVLIIIRFVKEKIAMILGHYLLSHFAVACARI